MPKNKKKKKGLKKSQFREILNKKIKKDLELGQENLKLYDYYKMKGDKKK